MMLLLWVGIFWYFIVVMWVVWCGYCGGLVWIWMLLMILYRMYFCGCWWGLFCRWMVFIIFVFIFIVLFIGWVLIIVGVRCWFRWWFWVKMILLVRFWLLIRCFMCGNVLIRWCWCWWNCLIVFVGFLLCIVLRNVVWLRLDRFLVFWFCGSGGWFVRFIVIWLSVLMSVDCGLGVFLLD